MKARAKQDPSFWCFGPFRNTFWKPQLKLDWLGFWTSCSIRVFKSRVFGSRDHGSTTFALLDRRVTLKTGAPTAYPQPFMLAQYTILYIYIYICICICINRYIPHLYARDTSMYACMHAGACLRHKKGTSVLPIAHLRHPLLYGLAPHVGYFGCKQNPISRLYGPKSPDQVVGGFSR